VSPHFLLVVAGSALFTFLEFYLLFMNVYLFGISTAGLRRKPEHKILVPLKSFAIVVPAHNEEHVIAETVKSLRDIDYPKELFEVLVVADNCSDSTEERARKAGAQVLVRTNDTDRGKPHAVRAGMEHALATKRPDAVVIVDADNVVSRNLLLEFNSRLIQGEKVIQAYLDSKNPDDSWVSSMYAISYWILARFIQLAPSQLGLPCQLGGTGYCIETETLERYGWDVTSLTDDLEYTMRVVLNDITPTWAHDAIVYDEKPLTMKASLRQRLRWMQGHWDVATRYTGPLLRKAFRERDPGAFHCAIYCLGPTRTILWGMTLVFIWIPLFAPDVTSLAIHPMPGAWFGLVLSSFFLLYPLLILALEHVPPRFFSRFVLMFVFQPTWIPVAWLGLFRRKKQNWAKTEHTRTVSVTDAELNRGRKPAPAPASSDSRAA